MSRPQSRLQNRGRWVKGESGNPGGIPKGRSLVSKIREETDDGSELVAFMLKALRGRIKGATVRDKIAAATWLADRGFDKPVESYRLQPDPDFDGAVMWIGGTKEEYIAGLRQLRGDNDDGMQVDLSEIPPPLVRTPS